MALLWLPFDNINKDKTILAREVVQLSLFDTFFFILVEIYVGPTILYKGGESVSKSVSNMRANTHVINLSPRKQIQKERTCL
jgi:hypothetical protein